MRVTVIGAGHVGLVTAACLAHVGHDVVVDDDDVSKLDLIREGRSWFFEPGLQELLGEVVRSGRLRIAGDKAEAVGHGTVIFICVGTPSRGDGSPNLALVEAVAREVARYLPEGEFRLVCEKSTVPKNWSTCFSIPSISRWMPCISSPLTIRRMYWKIPARISGCSGLTVLRMLERALVRSWPS